MSTWNLEASQNDANVWPWRRMVGSATYTVVTLLLLALFHQQLQRFFWSPNSWRVALPFAGAAVGGLLFAWLRYSAFTVLLSTSLRASAAGILVSLLFESPDFTLANPDTALTAARFVEVAYWPAVACAVASLFRPSFALAPALYVLSTRLLVMPISGLPMSMLDMRFMIDMTLYLGAFGIAVVTLRRFVGNWLTSPDRELEIVGAAFGLHLANYFWSGIAKAAAGPTPWYWVLNNETYNQMRFSLASGIQPLGGFPWLIDLAYKGFQWVYIPLNAAIILAQLFAIICVLRINWLKVASILYDMLHIGIYVFGGLFFWPWIWNNLTILLAARKAKGELSVNTKVACIVTIVLGAPALHLNEAAWLGWFDINVGRLIYFKAVTKDNHEVSVPTSFFLGNSYSVSHGYMGYFAKAGHYEATMQGATYDVTRQGWNSACPDPSTTNPGKEETPEAQKERQSMLGRLLKAHHEKMLAREASLGRFNYYLRLHHHPSNPMLYDEFHQLKLQDVVGYKLVFESGCFDIVDGQSVRKMWASDSEYYNVR